MNKITIALLAVLGMLAITSCDETPDPVDSCDTTGMTYTADIKEILDTSCAASGCHDMDATIGSLSDYDSAFAFVEFGRILGAINREEGFVAMPAGGAAKLEQCKIDKITAWINDGSPE